MYLLYVFRMSRTTVKIIITPTTMAATIAPEPGREAGREKSHIYKAVTVLFDKFKVYLKKKATTPLLSLL